MKIVSFILGFLLATAIMYWFNPFQEKPDDNNCREQLCKAYSADDIHSTLTAAIIQKMSEAYAKDKGKAHIYDTTGILTDKEDALHVVFDLEKIKALVYMMESKRCINKCADNIELGIRYYFIKYPGDLRIGRNEGDGLDNLDSTYRNKHSLAMVPAYWDKAKDKWIDYNPWTSSSDVCYPSIPKILNNASASAEQKGGKETLKPTLFLEPTNGGKNHGGLGPPPSPGTFPIGM